MQVKLMNAAGELLALREMQEDKQIAFNELKVEKAMLEAAGERISLEFSISLRDIQGTWQCNHLHNISTKLDWEFSIKSSQTVEIPYWCGFNIEGENVVALGLTCTGDDVELTFHMDQMRCTYLVIATVAIRPETEAFELLYSCSPRVWTELVGIWRDRILPQGKPDFPAEAYAPVYCTWYAIHGAMTNEYLDRNARLAANLGIGTFIVDDGWSYPRSRRVCPEELALGWYRCVGNWRVSAEKLPDFKKHVEYAQSLGLKYLLWVAPFFAGLDSERYHNAEKNSEKELVDCLWNEVAILNPAGENARQVAEQLKELMDELNLDGLKIDFLDQVPSSVQNPHSRDTLAYVRQLMATLRQGKPDALFEYRQNYATPQMLEFATQFRAGDVPFDFLTNFARLVELRLVLGDKVPCHADPIYFHPDEKPENVSRHFIAAMGGVPMLSFELEGLTKEHEAVIRHWLDFYRKHLELFMNGHWSLAYDRNDPKYLAVENQNEAIVIVAEASAIAELLEHFKDRSVIFLNLTGSVLRAPGVLGTDCFGVQCAEGSIPLAGSGEKIADRA